MEKILKNIEEELNQINYRRDVLYKALTLIAESIGKDGNKKDLAALTAIIEKIK